MIKRYDTNKEEAQSGLIEAGEFVFVSYCVGNAGQDMKRQVQGAFEQLEERLKRVSLTLNHVVKIDCLFKNIQNIPIMEEVIKDKFIGKYPSRKSYQSDFACSDVLFQIDAIAFRG